MRTKIAERTTKTFYVAAYVKPVSGKFTVFYEKLEFQGDLFQGNRALFAEKTFNSYLDALKSGRKFVEKGRS
jgi:hypothetical protein